MIQFFVEEVRDFSDLCTEVSTVGKLPVVRTPLAVNM